MWQCLYLQRPCPLPGFSYFAVFGTFLSINLWAVVCRPQPIIARRMWGTGLYKNTVTNCQIVSTWGHQKRMRFEPGSFECCVYKQQPTNPTHYAFKIQMNHLQASCKNLHALVSVTSICHWMLRHSTHQYFPSKNSLNLQWAFHKGCRSGGNWIILPQSHQVASSGAQWLNSTDTNTHIGLRGCWFQHINKYGQWRLQKIITRCSVIIHIYQFNMY